MHSFAKEYFFVASNEHAAEVIGSNGWKIKAIAKSTQTQIKCPSPTDTPIFCISGTKHNVIAAKKMIQFWAENFDAMKLKKRSIELEPGDRIETIMFNSVDVSCIIGKKGAQIRKISNIANVKIISPDVNKEPIFILSGKENNLKCAKFWIKLTTFCSTGAIYFDHEDMLILENLRNCSNEMWTQQARDIISSKRLIEKFHLLSSDWNYPQMERVGACGSEPYNCCYCRMSKPRVAKGLCGHVISCDLCIVDLYRDIYLRCHFCKVKVENFLIE